MKTLRFAWLCAGLLVGLGRALAQAPASLLARAALPPPATQRVFLGGPPQPLAPPAGSTELKALLRQLAQAARQPLDSAAQASVRVSTLLELTQQLADLRQQLTATQRLAAELLREQTELTDLRQQLNLLQSQQAAAASHGSRFLGWPAD